jgi:hypothetical protein
MVRMTNLVRSSQNGSSRLVTLALALVCASFLALSGCATKTVVDPTPLTFEASSGYVVQADKLVQDWLTTYNNSPAVFTQGGPYSLGAYTRIVSKTTYDKAPAIEIQYTLRPGLTVQTAPASGFPVKFSVIIYDGAKSMKIVNPPAPSK